MASIVIIAILILIASRVIIAINIGFNSQNDFDNNDNFKRFV